jgi:hypothetical protein
MNQQERDELRAKHHVGTNEADDQCQACFSIDGYPCDVIRLLDELENKTECDHKEIDGSYYGTSIPDNEMDYQYGYCPKCGEKL